LVAPAHGWVQGFQLQGCDWLCEVVGPPETLEQAKTADGAFAVAFALHMALARFSDEAGEVPVACDQNSMAR
jgi:hypothetical protein